MKMFFVLALGRSGTQFLSALLAGDTRGIVHHEPRLEDPYLLALRHAGAFDRVLDQLLERRFREMLPAESTAEFYGEVNSYLRYEADWLARRFDPVLIHLVRDGRAFLRSVWIRPVFTDSDADPMVLPRDGDPWAERWGSLSRFERLCWYWTHTNEFLAARLERRVRFEDLLSDYDSFERGVLAPTGVRVPRERWQREISRPKNTSAGYRLKQLVRSAVTRDARRAAPPEPLPHWSQWDAERTDRFWSICGDAMRRFGYER